MAKPMKTLELHYPMIRFLIIIYSLQTLKNVNLPRLFSVVFYACLGQATIPLVS